MGESNSTRKKIIIIFIIVTVVLGGFFYFQYLEKKRHEPKVVFMNVGQGDASIIQFVNGEKMLVDCGANSEILWALGRNTAFYDRTIDYLVVTHPDLDHYGGCIDVLKKYDVNKIFVNGEDKKGDSYYAEWKTMSFGKNIETITVSTSLNISGVEFTFFSPDPSLIFPGKISDNDRSIIFRVDHIGKSFLFTGDMEEDLEKELVRKYCFSDSEDCPLDVDVLKVGHHGSDGSSSELFLQKVSPAKVVISVGKNKYGHPGLRALRHLERAGAKILRTDEIGDIKIR